MLYYARSENTEKKVSLQMYDVENVVYTDKKWLHFILSQIVQNAIKYFDKAENCLTIYSRKKRNKVVLVVKDNGCGIKQSEIGGVFEKKKSKNGDFYHIWE